MILILEKMPNGFIKYRITCDTFSCSYDKNHVVMCFLDMIDEIKKDGWTNKKAPSGNGWHNYCPVCSEDKKEEFKQSKNDREEGRWF